MSVKTLQKELFSKLFPKVQYAIEKVIACCNEGTSLEASSVIIENSWVFLQNNLRKYESDLMKNIEVALEKFVSVSSYQKVYIKIYTYYICAI